MSGFGRGTGNGGGDPRYSKEYIGTKSQYSREKQGRDEWRGKEERSHKKDTSDKIPVCHGCGVKGHKRPECPNRIASVRNTVTLKVEPFMDV